MKELDHDSTVNTSIMTDIELDIFDANTETVEEGRNESETDDSVDSDEKKFQTEKHLELEKVLSSLSKENEVDGFETVPLADDGDHDEPALELELTFSQDEKNTLSLDVCTIK